MICVHWTDCGTSLLELGPEPSILPHVRCSLKPVRVCVRGACVLSA